ncbi:hypothetical protein AOA81_06255 [Methanomassiliicoccales archaeon RumEn M2]|nr:hypothetical protein AOA81_06255 [Methanomassiliicoccales archaeon RumEn M2]
MMRQYIYDYIRSLNIIDEIDDIDFSDRAFAYDYNEVQELFFNESVNNYVILAGKTGLRKKDMIGRIFKDLQLRGVSKDDMLYLDYECPLIKELNPVEIVSKFVADRPDSQTLYLLVNEIQLIDDWYGFMEYVKNNHDHVKVISSSSTPPYIYEKMFDTGCNFCKIVVLSEKNDSNIKYETTTFGVFEEFKYNVKNGIVEIKGLTVEGKKMSFHRIPSEIERYPVTIIASGAFHDRKEIDSIEIPDSVSMIGDYAFSKCSGLKSIVLPKSLRYIGDHAFLGASLLSNIEGGDNIEHIGNSAFYGTEWIDHQGDFAVLGRVLYKYKGNGQIVNVPDDVETLAPYSFSDTEIVEVTLPKSVKLDEGVFYNCRELVKVNANLTDVPAFTFFGCRRLRFTNRISVADKFAFFGCDSLTRISVTIANACSFAFCSSLLEVNSLEVVGKGAFWNCINLADIDIADVESVGSCSFGRTCVREINVRSKSIGDYAFISCKELTRVSIGGVPAIGRSILFECDSVSEMSVSGKDKVRWYFGRSPDGLVKLTVNGDICDDFAGIANPCGI